jgi:hypothetical protein
VRVLCHQLVAGLSAALSDDVAHYLNPGLAGELVALPAYASALQSGSCVAAQCGVAFESSGNTCK